VHHTGRVQGICTFNIRALSPITTHGWAFFYLLILYNTKTMNLEERNSLLTAATDRTHSTFYCDLYGVAPGTEPLTLLSEAHWNKLPFTDKESLLACPLSERLFVPLGEVSTIIASSGTSGKPPLFSSRNYNGGLRNHLKYFDFSVPLLAVGALQRFEELYASLGKEMQVVALDPQAIASSVQIAQTVGAGALFIYTFLARPTTEALLAAGMGEQIVFILLVGEIASESLMTFLESSFPHAKIMSSYSLNEINGPMSYSCWPRVVGKPETHHASEGYYFELIDADTNEVVPLQKDAEGELVVSGNPGGHTSFPVVRYRTGDIVRVTEEQCAAHGQMSFAVLGRRETDFLRISGGALRVDEIERVLRLLGMSDDFALICREPQGEDTKITVELAVEVKQEKKEEANLEALAKSIASLLRVGPTLTFEDGVRKGMYHPLVVIERKPEYSTAKNKKMKRM